MLKLVLIPIISVGVYYAFDQDVCKPERNQ